MIVAAFKGKRWSRRRDDGEPMTTASWANPRRSMRTGRAALMVGAIVLAQLVSCWFASPLFDFPVNDDWAWRQSARSLALDGRLVLPEHAAMSLFGQTIYSGAWTALLGMKNEVLNLSTISLWLMLAVASFWMLCESGCDEGTSAIGTMMIVFNPLVVVLSRGYMTDVPFLAVNLLATAAWMRALREGSSRWWWLASFLSLWATMIRQLGVFPPLAVGMTLLARTIHAAFAKNAGDNATALQESAAPRRRSLSPWLAASAPVIGLALFSYWLHAIRGTTQNYRRTDLPPLPSLPGQIAFRCWIALLYLGLFTSPSQVAILWAKRSWGVVGAVGGIGIGMGAVYVVTRTRIPYLGNYMIGPGLGPVWLKDPAQLGYAHPLAWSRECWMILNALAVAGAAGLLVSMAQIPWRKAPSPTAFLLTMLSHPRWVVMGAAIGHLAFFCLVEQAFDRYLINLLAAAVLLGADAAPISRGGRWVTLVLTLAMGVWSIVQTEDYVSWNRTRWRLLDALMKEGVSSARIDGGLEFNAPPFFAGGGDSATATGPPGASSSFVIDDEYIISFSPQPGYRIVREATFPRRGRDPAVLYVLHREPRR